MHLGVFPRIHLTAYPGPSSLSHSLSCHHAELCHRRYFQSQGLFTVPTRIIVAIAPINAFLNWSFGMQAVRLPENPITKTVFVVHHLGLGFPGAPIATSFSFTLVSLVSIVYAYLFVPRTAWVPLGSGVWKGWGLLARLGVAGVGESVNSIDPNAPVTLTSRLC